MTENIKEKKAPEGAKRPPLSTVSTITDKNGILKTDLQRKIVSIFFKTEIKEFYSGSERKIFICLAVFPKIYFYMSRRTFAVRNFFLNTSKLFNFLGL